MRRHRDAVIAELESRLPGSVFRSYSAAEGLSRYAVVFIGRSGKPRTRYAGGQWRDVYTLTIHSVGEDEDLALWVEERVEPLTGKVLLVPGRKLRPVEYRTGMPADLNDVGPTPLWFTVSQFELISDPAGGS